MSKYKHKRFHLHAKCTRNQRSLTKASCDLTWRGESHDHIYFDQGTLRMDKYLLIDVEGDRRMISCAVTLLPLHGTKYKEGTLAVKQAK